MLSDCSDTGGHCDGGKVDAILKSTAANGADTGGNRDGVESGAIREGIVADDSAAGRDGKSADSARRTLDERSLAAVEKHPVHTAVGRVRRVDIDGGKP